MRKVAVVIADMFEDSEYAQPAEALQKAGHDLTHVGLQSGVTVKGLKKGTPVKVDKTAQEVKVADFDAPLIPGVCRRITCGSMSRWCGLSRSSWKAANRSA